MREALIALVLMSCRSQSSPSALLKAMPPSIDSTDGAGPYYRSNDTGVLWSPSQEPRQPSDTTSPAEKHCRQLQPKLLSYEKSISGSSIKNSLSVDAKVALRTNPNTASNPEGTDTAQDPDFVKQCMFVCC